MLRAAMAQAVQAITFAQTGFFTTWEARWIAIQTASSVVAVLTTPRG